MPIYRRYLGIHQKLAEHRCNSRYPSFLILKRHFFSSKNDSFNLLAYERYSKQWFVNEQRTINTDYYTNLLKDLLKISIRNTVINISISWFSQVKEGPHLFTIMLVYISELKRTIPPHITLSPELHIFWLPCVRAFQRVYRRKSFIHRKCGRL